MRDLWLFIATATTARPTATSSRELPAAPPSPTIAALRSRSTTPATAAARPSAIPALSISTIRAPAAAPISPTTAAAPSPLPTPVAPRTALGDQLTAKFAGQSYGARLEGGYRFAVPVSHGLVGITPYAAVQTQDFHTPSYSETDLTSGGLRLSYNAMNGTDTRSKLGGRFDGLTALGTMPLILRLKAAWAHDWVSYPARAQCRS